MSAEKNCVVLDLLFNNYEQGRVRPCSFFRLEGKSASGDFKLRYFAEDNEFEC